MSEPTATTRSMFSVRSSAFNDFLYAPIGEEENGMVLTALSALARSGVDPWDEAARLSELPREVATDSLISIISEAPSGQWPQLATKDIAARLAALLPGKQGPAPQWQVMAQAKPPGSPMLVMFLFVFLANALMFSVIRNHEAQPAVDQSGIASSTAASPQVPLADSE